MVDFKYKVTDIAKDFGISTKKVIETFAELTGETRKTGATFEEFEVYALMEALTRETAVKDLGEYLASGKEPQPVKQETKKPEAKPQAKKEAPKPEAAKPQPKQPKQPEAPKAEPKAEQAKPAQNAQPKAAQPKPVQQEKRNDKRNDNKQAEKRSEKRVTMQELASETGIKEPVATEQVKVDRAQVSVDTRTVDVNVDKFSARYDDLADSRNMPSKRKNAPTGKKEKFNNRNNRRGQQFGRRRETEAERLQRIQLEKARNAQLKISIPDEITVGELATRLKQNVAKVVAKFMQMGEMHAASDVIDFDSAALIAEEFHAKVEHEVHVSIEERLFTQEEDSADQLVERPPVVVVMGHVDHGKTSILDRIRSTNVTAGEAGGITQAIGAYQVNVNGSPVTFLDTPGHEAFTAMRARGAKVTDIAIIIVAADDNVMPQTVEAINHASAAGVPIVFAINKIDKPHANPDKIKEELANMNYLVEDWGGKYQSQEISAKKGIGVEDLLEKVLLEADLLDLKANPKRRAVGSIIESSLDKGRGYVSTVLVENGTLKVGDIVLAGTHFGRVKAMFNERNQRIEKAGPSEPALILGLNGAPQAGDTFNVLETDQEAREIANRREQLQRELGLRTQKMLTLDDIGRRIAVGNFQELNVIVKGDVDGSVEALSDSLIRLSTEEIQVNVIHKAVGQISESDVVLAAASDAIIIGFQVRPALPARRLAEKEGVEIRLYSIIYDAIEEVKSAMEGMLSPEIKEEITANVEVLQVFKITKVGTIAGCMVREGKIKRSNKVRVIRDGIVVHSGELESLKRFKDDVKEVVAGLDCGLNIVNYNDIQVGDIIEAYEETEIKKTL